MQRQPTCTAAAFWVLMILGSDDYFLVQLSFLRLLRTALCKTFPLPGPIPAAAIKTLRLVLFSLPLTVLPPDSINGVGKRQIGKIFVGTRTRQSSDGIGLEILVIF